MLKSFNLNQNETDLLIKILKDWYCLNNDSNLFTPPVNKLLLKINSMNFKIPSYLYRAYSFERKEDYNNFINNAEKRIAHPSKDYESWTSSLTVAKRYMPGGEGQLNKNAKIGIILKIPRFDFEDRIKFSIENLFKNYSDRKILFSELFSYMSKDILQKIKIGNLSKQDILEFQHSIPGLVRAISEFEYMIGPLDYPKPECIELIGIENVPFRYISENEIKGLNIRHKRLKNKLK